MALFSTGFYNKQRLSSITYVGRSSLDIYISINNYRMTHLIIIQDFRDTSVRFNLYMLRYHAYARGTALFTREIRCFLLSGHVYFAHHRSSTPHKYQKRKMLQDRSTCTTTNYPIFSYLLPVLSKSYYTNDAEKKLMLRTPPTSSNPKPRSQTKTNK